MPLLRVSPAHGRNTARRLSGRCRRERRWRTSAPDARRGRPLTPRGRIPDARPPVPASACGADPSSAGKDPRGQGAFLAAAAGCAGGAMTPRLELRGISKTFPGVVANDDVSLRVMPGEIHAVLGENGAGKSTLMKIIYGAMAADRGEIFWDGEPVRIPNPAAARHLGIGMVYQHFSLFESVSVAENIAVAVDGALRPPGAFRPRPRAVATLRPAARPRPPPRPPLRGRTPAGGDRALPSAAPQAPDPRRAHLGAHPPGREAPVRDPAGGRGRRVQPPLHQPQARRNPRALRQRDRPAARRGCRRRRSEKSRRPPSSRR